MKNWNPIANIILEGKKQKQNTFTKQTSDFFYVQFRKTLTLPCMAWYRCAVTYSCKSYPFRALWRHMWVKKKTRKRKWINLTAKNLDYVYYRHFWYCYLSFWYIFPYLDHYSHHKQTFECLLALKQNICTTTATTLEIKLSSATVKSKSLIWTQARLLF